MALEYARFLSTQAPKDLILGRLYLKRDSWSMFCGCPIRQQEDFVAANHVFKRLIAPACKSSMNLNGAWKSRSHLDDKRFDSVEVFSRETTPIYRRIDARTQISADLRRLLRVSKPLSYDLAVRHTLIRQNVDIGLASFIPHVSALPHAIHLKRKRVTSGHVPGQTSQAAPCESYK